MDEYTFKRFGADPSTKFAVVSLDLKPFLLGVYSTLENAKRAQNGKPHVWAIYKRIDGED